MTSAHVVHTTAKQVILRRGKNENVREMSKNKKNGRAKREKLLFFTPLSGDGGIHLENSCKIRVVGYQRAVLHI